MTPDVAAIWTLAAYLLTAIGIVYRQTRHRCCDWQVCLLYTITRMYIPLMYHWRSDRICPFPEEGPAIIIANHRSPVDPMLIWTNHHRVGRSGRIRVIRFLTAKEYFDIPVIGWICRTMQSIPVARDGRDIKPTREALSHLKAGGWIGVFPEGGIKAGADLQSANTGIAWLALRANVPVYPVYIENAPRGRHMAEPFYNPSRVRIRYGNPIDLSGFAGRHTSRELLHEITGLMMQRLADLGGVRYAGCAMDTPVQSMSPNHSVTG